MRSAAEMLWASIARLSALDNTRDLRYSTSMATKTPKKAAEIAAPCNTPHIDAAWLDAFCEEYKAFQYFAESAFGNVEAVFEAKVFFKHDKAAHEVLFNRRQAYKSMQDRLKELEAVRTHAVALAEFEALGNNWPPPKPDPIPAKVWIVYGCKQVTGRTLNDDIQLYVGSSHDKAVAFATAWLDSKSTAWICAIRPDTVDTAKSTIGSEDFYVTRDGTVHAQVPDLAT